MPRKLPPQRPGGRPSPGSGKGRPAARPASPDVIVIGGGLVGLACTLALAERGLRVVLLADVRAGEASPAAGGILAPSVDRVTGPAHDFAIAARDRFPAFVRALAEHTGIDVPWWRAGVIELVEREIEADAARASAIGRGAEWLDTQLLSEAEPALAPMPGALRYEDDAVVNNLVLMRALKARVGRHSRVLVANDPAEEISFPGQGAEVRTRLGATVSTGHVVLAAGAWAPQLAGLPRPLPIEPVRGQMLSIAATLVTHAVISLEGYLVPRGDGRTLLGGTLERVGYEPATTPEGLALVRARAEAICPAVGRSRTLNGWAGLRPMTPDLQPIIGPDPDQPSLVYACGHSRNGVLLAPATGEVVASMVAGERPALDVSAFAVDRFG
jgi:glycine oxidase